MSVQYELSEKFSSDSNKEYVIHLVDGVSGAPLFESTETIVNPFGLDLVKFVPNRGFLNLERLYELASATIDWKQSLENVPDDERVKLHKDWADTRFHQSSDLERITCRLISREPAKMSADGKKFKQRRPMWDREYRSSDAPAHVITIYSQPMDHELEFVCWAKDSRRADARAIWLERLFVDYAWVFKSEGADIWEYKRRLSDIVISQDQHIYHQRPLRFFARLRELEALYEPELSRIEFTSSISNN